MTAKSEWKSMQRSLSGPMNGHLVVIGLNYHSSPIAIRERFIIPQYCLSHALHALARFPHVKEAVVLSTCNRTEVYAVVNDLQAGMAEVESFFMQAQNIADHGSLRPNFRLLHDDVALHLFRVASGLDSMVLGEGQIMSQVKAALKSAQDAGTTGPALDQIFQLALNCGKRVRTETQMGRRAVSVSSAAVELAREITGNLSEQSVLVIGAGKMAKISAKHLLAEGGDGAVLMINRTPERVAEFAQNRLPNNEKLRSQFNFGDRYHLAAAAGVVIVSTSAPEYVLELSEFQKVHTGQPLCIIDISVPRNVDPAIGELPAVRLFHTDHLSQIVDRNLAERESLVSQAEVLVFETLQEFHAWQRSLLVVPTITGLRKKIESIRAEQLQKTPACRQEELLQAEQLSKALVNRILHHPTVQLKSTLDREQLLRQAHALQTLFELDVFDRDLK
ncbi:MAG TPA: glutamyl-tRNA reductase [Candidatus Obscuribacterales bacterium]